MAKPAKNTICLWYDGTAEEAARFYAATFPDSFVGKVIRAPGDFPSGKQGDVLVVEFTVMGIPCIGLNGGPAFTHNEAFSFQVATDTQERPTATGTPCRQWRAGKRLRLVQGQMGRQLADHAVVLTEAIADPDPAAAKRAFEAMMEMGKIDIAAIEAARRG